MRSLEAVSEFAGSELVGGNFKDEVRKLVARLSTALYNQMKMAKYRHDPEKLAELYLSTSEGYKVPTSFVGLCIYLFIFLFIVNLLLYFFLFGK